MLNRPRNPTWEMLGSNAPAIALPRVRQEGYGGWTWNDFLAFNDPTCASRQRKRSPFLFDREGGGVQLDIARYLRERCGAQPPDVAIFMLGGNDVWNGEPDRPEALSELLTQIMKDADTLIAEFRRAAPGMTIAILIPPQLTAFDAPYDMYGTDFPRWRVRQNYHGYQECLLDHFAGLEKDDIHLIPTFLSVDAIDAYAANLPATFNDLGEQQLAGSVYAWLKYRYAKAE
jgi:hypothetical protein